MDNYLKAININPFNSYSSMESGKIYKVKTIEGTKKLCYKCEEFDVEGEFYNYPKSDFLIFEFDKSFSDFYKDDKCRIISFEWGIGKYSDGCTVLFKKEYLNNVINRVKKGLSIC